MTSWWICLAFSLGDLLLCKFLLSCYFLSWIKVLGEAKVLQGDFKGHPRRRKPVRQWVISELDFLQSLNSVHLNISDPIRSSNVSAKRCLTCNKMCFFLGKRDQNFHTEPWLNDNLLHHIHFATLSVLGPGYTRQYFSTNIFVFSLMLPKTLATNK